MLSIKQPGTKVKSRFIVQCHKDKERELIVHISKTVRQKNIKILISLSVIYELGAWNQDVNQAYI